MAALDNYRLCGWTDQELAKSIAEFLEPDILKALQAAQDTMEAHASADDLREWHLACNRIVGTAYPKQA